VPLCHVKPVGNELDVLVVLAYSTVWLPGLLPETVIALTEKPVEVGVPFTVGAPLTLAPSPRATEDADTLPEIATAAVAPLTLPCATVEGIVIFAELPL